EIMGINIDKNLKHARRFLEKHPVSFAIFTDPEASVISSFHARGMPSSFLIDPEGVIRWIKFGFSGSQIRQFEDQIKTLLEVSSHVQKK
ncbi:MAG: peroxiredoxin family protein, partial [Nitrospiria bacterium]